MSLFTIIRQIFAFEFKVDASNSYPRNSSAADTDSETLSEPKTWNAGQELQKRADEVERVESTVRIIGSSSDEWIEGPAMEVQR